MDSIGFSKLARQFLTFQDNPCTKLLVRGNSGFATPEVYEACEANQSQYVVRLKKNKIMAKMAESFILIGNDHPWEEKEVHYYSTTYRAKSWTKARRICIRSTREANELLFRHEYLVTNCPEELSARTMFQLYHNRGTMENFIKSIYLPPKEVVFQVETLRLRLFKVAEKLVKSGRRLFLKLSSSHVCKHLLQKINNWPGKPYKWAHF